MKRVVVTGLGIVSPIGIGIEETWANAIRGKSGIAPVTQIDLTNEPVQIAGEVKNFSPAEWMNEKEAKRTQRFVQFGIAAAKMAVKDAGLEITDELAPHVGVSMGVGVGGMGFMEENILTMANKGSKWVSPFTIPGFIANMASGGVSIETRAKGPNICPATACASGTHAIGEALMLIQTGRAKAMIAGGTESTITALPFAGFGKMGALCKSFNDNPTKASRPFDKDRCGFVMGEGAGVLILEEYEFAKARGAKIICELAGYGLTGDAYHITLPPPGGEGAARAMKQALETGNIKPEDVDYINAHGTSTEANDQLETAAIKTVFGNHAQNLNISSTKSMTGHLLGAAGGVEAVFTVMALKTGIIPPTINLENPDPACDLNYTPNTAVERRVNAAISNSFGFGGTNACIAFKSMQN
jgi:3-oxoacyl-[acyl-carrier-protein] synthase II